MGVYFKRDGILSMKKAKQTAKSITLGIIIVGFLVGVIGAFTPVFNMNGYVTFIKGFSTLYIPLIASIGVNSGITKITQSKETKGREDE